MPVPAVNSGPNSTRWVSEFQYSDLSMAASPKGNEVEACYTGSQSIRSTAEKTWRL